MIKNLEELSKYVNKALDGFGTEVTVLLRENDVEYSFYHSLHSCSLPNHIIRLGIGYVEINRTQ